MNTELQHIEFREEKNQEKKKKLPDPSAVALFYPIAFPSSQSWGACHRVHGFKSPGPRLHKCTISVCSPAGRGGGGGGERSSQLFSEGNPGLNIWETRSKDVSSRSTRCHLSGWGGFVEDVAMLAGGFSMQELSCEMTFIAIEIHVCPRSIPVTVVLTALLLGLVRGRAPRARSLAALCAAVRGRERGSRRACPRAAAAANSNNGSSSSRSGLRLASKAVVTVPGLDGRCHVCCYIMILTPVPGHFRYVIFF